jgi:hypothetical protein
MNPEWPITPAEARYVDNSRAGNLLKHTGFPFEDRRRPGQSCARQPHGKHFIRTSGRAPRAAKLEADGPLKNNQ